MTYKLLPFLRRLFACALLAVTCAQAATASPELEARISRLSERLRCLVCQNQSIAESQADLANDLRRQVREMLVAGKSDEDVVAFMVARYGDFVLYEPPVKTSTLLLWGGPAVLLVVALAGFGFSLRRRRVEKEAMLSPAEMARAQTLLDKEMNSESRNT